MQILSYNERREHFNQIIEEKKDYKENKIQYKFFFDQPF